MALLLSEKVSTFVSPDWQDHPLGLVRVPNDASRCCADGQWIFAGAGYVRSSVMEFAMPLKM